jgi:endonuclease/exonuclease/phosphatase family metal-dependent hydrolase
MEVIRQFGPHVLAVQEALAFQNEEILAAFPRFVCLGVGRDDGAIEGEFASVFYDRDSLSAVDSGTFWFSDRPDDPGSRHPDCYHPRICTWAGFSEGLAVYNLHLDNVSAESRNMAVDQLLASIKPAFRTIITGDFNAGESDACIAKLRVAGWRDSFRVLEPAAVDVGTYHGFGSVTIPDKIDYIWVDSNWAVLQADIMNSKPEDQWPSDHYPITATLATLAVPS